MRTAPAAFVAVAVLTALPGAAQTADFTVTVGTKTASNPQPCGCPCCYYIDGSEMPALTLVRGRTYRFLVTSTCHHPFYLSTSSTGGGAEHYTQGVTGQNACEGATLTFTPDAAAPALLYYQCDDHECMGWRISIVNPPCPADFNGDGAANLNDFLAYLTAFAAADLRADFDGNGQVNVQDFLGFLQAFAAGC
jgi:hypothetical protein